MLIYYLAALGAAFCWSCASIIARHPVKEIGSFSFVRIRMVVVFLPMLFYSIISGKLLLLQANQINLIILSGLIGIFLGDSCLFFCLKNLGPRKAQLLFCLHAPFTAILASFFFNDLWTWQLVYGTFFVCSGIILAISFGKKEIVNTDLTPKKIRVSIILGIIAAMSQAVGILLLKPIFLDETADIFTISTLRVGIAALALVCVRISPKFKARKPLTLKIFSKTAINGILAIGIGMTLVVFALKKGNAGIVATLSATTPVIILPLLWLVDKKKPHIFAWIGALLSVIGCFFIFN